MDILKFIFIYEQSEFKKLTVQQRSGLETLLKCLSEDQEMQDIRWQAYCLATVYHETAHTFLPIAEYGKGKGRSYGIKDKETGQTYYGRGFVQITWKTNYAKMSKICGVDLVNNPDLAMGREVAYKIMSYGMRNGSFTGVGLKKYINDKKCDFIGARKIINGTDCAEKIAGYAVKFQHILEESNKKMEA